MLAIFTIGGRSYSGNRTLGTVDARGRLFVTIMLTGTVTIRDIPLDPHSEIDLELDDGRVLRGNIKGYSAPSTLYVTAPSGSDGHSPL